MTETDPIDLEIIDGDLVFSDGDLVLTAGPEGVCQLCVLRLGTIRGEYFLDEEEGMPWFENENRDRAILGRTFDERYVREQATNILNSTPGVGKIVSITVDYVVATRTGTLTFVVQTTFGEEITGTLEI